LLLIATGLTQTSVMPQLSLWGLTPDLLLLVVVSWGLLRGLEEVVPLALAGGLLLDLLSGGPFGVATVSLTVATTVTSLSQLRIPRESAWLPLFGAGLGTVLYDGLYWTILRLTGRDIPWSLALLQVVLPSLAWNCLLMYVVYGWLRRLHRRAALRQVE
jgi:rod shape-determining protein MreD